MALSPTVRPVRGPGGLDRCIHVLVSEKLLDRPVSQPSYGRRVVNERRKAHRLARFVIPAFRTAPSGAIFTRARCEGKDPLTTSGGTVTPSLPPLPWRTALSSAPAPKWRLGCAWPAHRGDRCGASEPLSQLKPFVCAGPRRTKAHPERGLIR